MQGLVWGVLAVVVDHALHVCVAGSGAKLLVSVISTAETDSGMVQQAKAGSASGGHVGRRARAVQRCCFLNLQR